MRGIFTYVQYSDVTPSRLLQRAVERELARLARTDQKLKLKLEKVLNGMHKTNSPPSTQRLTPSQFTSA
jgi:hypothetical protein